MLDESSCTSSSLQMFFCHFPSTILSNSAALALFPLFKKNTRSARLYPQSPYASSLRNHTFANEYHQSTARVYWTVRAGLRAEILRVLLNWSKVKIIFMCIGLPLFLFWNLKIFWGALHRQVVQKVDNAIHRINRDPADSVVCFANTYPLDADLSGG